MKSRGLSHEETVKYYDGFGAKQDKQGFYEDAALADMMAHADFGLARRVAEFGCGTGRIAANLLREHLPADATYWGCDVSDTMLGLSKERLAKFGERATLWKSAGDTTLPLEDESVDRFISNYVLDILSADEISAVIGEAKRVLKKDGLLCLVSLTHGKGIPSKVLTAFWNLGFSLNPGWVGGCRPVELLDFLDGWEIVHHNVVVASAISSEVVVAKKR